MKSKLFFIPLFLILVAWFAFSYKYFLQDKVPYPSAYQVAFFPPWSAYEQFWGPVKNNAMPDIIGQIYPWRNLTVETWKMGQIPLWNPYSFSGTPHLANYQSAALSPFNLLFVILPFIDAWSLLVLLQPLLAGIFTYLYMRSIAISQKGSLVSAFSFMFCGFLTTWMGYATLPFAILFLPLALFSVEKWYRTRRFRYLYLLLFTIPFSFFSGHFQTSIYFAGVVLLYQIVRIIDIKSKKALFTSLTFYAGGFILSLPQILPSIEFYQYSVRSGIIQKLEVIPWSYIPTIIAPDFYGNAVTRNDWFGHYAEWSSYAGVVPLLLAVFAFTKRRSLVLFFGALGIGALFLAYNSPLISLIVMMKIPVLSTSAASRIVVLFSFSVAVLAGIGLDRLSELLTEQKRSLLLRIVLIPIAVIGVLWAVLLILRPFESDKLLIAIKNSIIPSALVLYFVGSIAGMVLFPKKKIMMLVLVGFIVVSLLEMLRFSSKWMMFDPKEYVFPETQTTNFYEKISSYDRIVGDFGAENAVYYKLPVMDGYDPLYIARYGEFIDYVADAQINGNARSVIQFPKNGEYTPQAIELLGAKYLSHRISDGRAVWAFPFWEYPIDQFKLIHDDSKYQVFENNRAFPRAFVVGSSVIETNPKMILESMFDSESDLKQVVFLEKGEALNIGSTGSAAIQFYSPNTISIEAVASDEAYLVLTDTWYPGWKAYVDDEESEVLRANHSFRAVKIPQGESEVVFQYEPMSFWYGVYAAISGIVAFGLLLIVLRFKR